MGKYRAFYQTLSLSELRRRQRITATQIVTAYRNKQTRGLIRLQRVFSLLTATIYEIYS